MKTNIVQIGNSKGVRIPKTLLEQLKFEKSIEFQVTPEGLLLRPVHELKENNLPPRAGWTEKFRAALAETGDDALEFAEWNRAALTAFDDREW